MAHNVRAGDILCIPRDLLAFHNNIIAAAELSRHAHAAQHFHHGLSKFLEVDEGTAVFWHRETEVEIA